MWCIFDYPMHHQSHAIIRLDVHLPHQQNVVFRQGHEREAIENIRRTKLLAFFELNRIDPAARYSLYLG